MKKMTYNGYTLVELLVVISILSLLGVFAMLNLAFFKKEQALNTALINTQSRILATQASATTNLKCPLSDNTLAESLSWKSLMSRREDNSFEVVTVCEHDNDRDGNVSLEVVNREVLPGNIIFSRGFAGLDDGNCETEFTTPQSVIVTFSPLYGNIGFGHSPDQILDSCFKQGKTATVVFKNLDSNQTKAILVDKSRRVLIK